MLLSGLHYFLIDANGMVVDPMTLKWPSEESLSSINIRNPQGSSNFEFYFGDAFPYSKLYSIEVQGEVMHGTTNKIIEALKPLWLNLISSRAQDVLHVELKVAKLERAFGIYG